MFIFSILCINEIVFNKSMENDILMALIYNSPDGENDMSFSLNFKQLYNKLKNQNNMFYFCNLLFNETLYLNKLNEINRIFLYVYNEIKKEYNPIKIKKKPQLIPKLNKNINSIKDLYKIYCENLEKEIKYEYFIIVCENETITNKIETEILQLYEQLLDYNKIPQDKIMYFLYNTFKQHCIFNVLQSFYGTLKSVTKYNILKKEIFNIIESNNDKIAINTYINGRPVIIIPNGKKSIEPMEYEQFELLCESRGIIYLHNKYQLSDIINLLMEFTLSINYYE